MLFPQLSSLKAREQLLQANVEVELDRRYFSSPIFIEGSDLRKLTGTSVLFFISYAGLEGWGSRQRRQDEE